MSNVYRSNVKRYLLILIGLAAAYTTTMLPFYLFISNKNFSSQKPKLLTYQLDRTCMIKTNASGRVAASERFQSIFSRNAWRSRESRSGQGSNVRAALEWVLSLKYILDQYDIRYVADIPCGDTNWQFASREMNTLPFYFGGDIATGVVAGNQERYRYHHNKLFLFWDIVSCPLPWFSIDNGSDTIVTNRTFDLVIMRDAIQHMNILNGLAAVKNIIFSGAKYFLVSSYPRKCVDFCRAGNITDGKFYRNNMNCPPFEFPAPLFRKPSHNPPVEKDEIHLYKIDDDLKERAKHYDNKCR